MSEVSLVMQQPWSQGEKSVAKQLVDLDRLLVSIFNVFVRSAVSHMCGKEGTWM